MVTKEFYKKLYDLLPEYEREQTLTNEYCESLQESLTNALLSFGAKCECVGYSYEPTFIRYNFKDLNGKSYKIACKEIDNVEFALKLYERIRVCLGEEREFSVEIPHDAKRTVSLKEVMAMPSELTENTSLNFAVGLGAEPINLSLRKCPNILIAGATGTGKSILLINLILSLAMQYTAKELNFVLIDPKMVELNAFASLPHAYKGRTFTSCEETYDALCEVIDVMEERYLTFAKTQVKNISEYNEWARANGKEIMPYTVVIVDEYFDLLYQKESDIQNMLINVAQKGRAAGVHLIATTQCVSKDLLQNIFSSHLTTRISLKTCSEDDSKLILGSKGAERLTGRGDLLVKPVYSETLQRAQGAYMGYPAVLEIIEAIAKGE